MLKRIIGWLSVAASAALVLGCGGGSSGGCMLPSGCGSGGTEQAAYKLVLSATDTSTETGFDNINGALIYGRPVRISAALTDKNGKAVPGQVVSFTIDQTSIATLTDGGSVLTDSNGNGSLTISAVSPSSAGALTLNASAAIVVGSTSDTATAKMSFRINSTAVVTPAGTPAFLQYVSTTPTRLFVSGGSQGSNNAAEEAVTSYKVLDKDNNAVPNAVVLFDVTKRSGGILTNGSASEVSVSSDSQGIAKVTVKSGTEPLSINVIARLQTIPATLYYSNDQIVISNLKPDQKNIFMLWDPSSDCGKASSTTRTYPCKFIVTVGDENGQPVADGTVVSFVSDTGVIVADVLASQPSGACLTVNSQCSAEYTGKPGVTWGMHHVVAYTVGYNAPQGKPITLDGSWVANGDGSNVKVAVPDANSYIRDCMQDNGPTVAFNTCVPVN